MDSKIIISILIIAVVFFSGCNEPNSCGDGVCDTANGENDISCPEDCSSFHLACEDNSCAVVEGSGADECVTDSDCA